MNRFRSLKAIGLSCGIVLMAGCNTFAPSPPPPMVRPPAFTALGLSAAYLYSDVVGGHRARAAKMKAAKIRPLSAGAAPAYMANLASELRRQTAGIGLDVLQVGNGIIVRIPAEFTFDPGSSAVKIKASAVSHRSTAGAQPCGPWAVRRSSPCWMRIRSRNGSQRAKTTMVPL